MLRRVTSTALALALAAAPLARAEDFREFNSKGMPGSQGIAVHVRYPAAWRMVETDDEIALAELRGPQGRATGILQVARGRPRQGADAQCDPERAPTMLRQLSAEEADARVTDVFARSTDGRPGYEIRYERNNAPSFLLAHGVIVCLKNSRVLVSCGGTAESKAALADVEPACRQVLESVTISED